MNETSVDRDAIRDPASPDAVTPDAGDRPSVRVDLAIGGMTCAACSSRIQRQLSRVDGVARAQVNFANGRATVHHEGTVGFDTLRGVVEGLGYSVVDDEGRDAAEAQRRDDLQRRLVVAVALSLPVVAISMLTPLRFDGWEWVVAALATPVVFWSGWPFHKAAFMNLRHGSTTMDTLVSMGSSAAWGWSAVVLVADLGGHVYFETGAVIVTLILLGKWLEARATRRSGDAIRALADLTAQTAELEDGRRIDVSDLAVGMRFVVRPGSKIATDGVVVDGSSSVDASMVTGEPVPVTVGPGSEVIGATINAEGSLVVEATRVGADTALAQIIRLVDAAQGSRADVQRLADRVSAVFVPVAIAISVVTLLAWLVTGQAANDAFTAAVAVLIIACPCALGLATPLAIMVGTGRGAQLGVIIKGGEVLEDSRSVTVAVVDKTGTLTEGAMVLTDVVASGLSRERLLSLAGAVEAKSEHPIARTIAAAEREALDVESFTNRPGQGVVGTVDGAEVRVGRRQLFDSVPDEIEEAARTAEGRGSTVVFAGRDGVAEGVLVVEDEVKPTSSEAVEMLHDLDLEVWLLSGDNVRTAEAVGAEVGVDTVIAGVLPDEKAKVIRELQDDGHRVAMIGDGINDAPALAQADLGVAVGTGTDVAIEASDLTIVSGDLRAAADAIDLARHTLAVIRGNLFWAFAYNSAALPLAALGVLNPMIAAGAMGLSSLCVVSNSLRLRQFRGSRLERSPQEDST